MAFESCIDLQANGLGFTHNTCHLYSTCHLHVTYHRYILNLPATKPDKILKNGCNVDIRLAPATNLEDGICCGLRNSKILFLLSSNKILLKHEGKKMVPFNESIVQLLRSRI